MNTFVIIGVVAFIVIFRIANAAARQAQKQRDRIAGGSTSDGSMGSWDMMPTAQAPRKPNLPPELQAEIAKAMRSGKLPTHKVQKARPVGRGAKPAGKPGAARVPAMPGSLTSGAGSLFQDRTSIGAGDASLFQDKTTAGAKDASLFQDKTSDTEAKVSSGAPAAAKLPLLADRAGVRQAILVSEVLGPPVSLRRGLGREGT